MSLSDVFNLRLMRQHSEHVCHPGATNENGIMCFYSVLDLHLLNNNYL